MPKKPPPSEADSIVRFKVHPRVFAALGADLVTSDVIAIMELVKNSYDALASRVDVRLLPHDSEKEQMVLEVEDDGTGMDKKTIERVWALVGTPYRKDNPTAKRGKKIRRVTGEKGLGRLSAARLGTRLTMITKAASKTPWQVEVDWGQIHRSKELGDCTLRILPYAGRPAWKKPGTLVRILGLRSDWLHKSDEEIKELRDQLARFLPPFQEKDDFQIWLSLPHQGPEPTRLERPKFLDNPPYSLTGTVDAKGRLKAAYRYDFDGRKRNRTIETSLEAPPADLSESVESVPEESAQTCGPFAFEFRVWDLEKDVLLRLAERFNYVGKAHDLRLFISKGPYSGISLYRDGVLVLPKTESNADWLKLNLRRVSRVGTRLSVSQIVGFIDIGGKKNPRLRDTSDRERLIDNPASRTFTGYMNEILRLLEDERAADRTESAHKEPPFTELFEELRDRGFKDRIIDLANMSAPVDQFVRAAEDHEKTVDKVVDKIQTRLVYYSRLASLGTLAGILQHEVGNHSVTIDDFFLRTESFFNELGKAAAPLLRKLEIARQSLRSLQRLSDTFSPLASQTYATRRRKCVFEETLQAVVAMLQKDIDKSAIRVALPQSTTPLAVDPGELTAILFNLISNSVYWLARQKSDKSEIAVHVKRIQKSNRAEIYVHDSGPGVQPGDEERIFWPGVTRKPDGIGMGLTVASELVAQHGGRMFLSTPGKMDGASFGFDLPLDN